MLKSAVVPSYYLVWYNRMVVDATQDVAVVPSYYLVWYNFYQQRGIYTGL